MSPELQSLSTGLAAAAAVVVTTFLLRSARPVARQDNGMTVVEYGRVVKFVVIVFWVCFVGVAVVAAFARPDQRNTAYTVVAAFFLAVLALHLEFFHVTIRYDGAGLHTTSPWRRRRFIPWSAITGVHYSAAAQWYVVSTSDKGRVRLHLYLSGLQSLLDELTRRGFSIPPSPRRR